MMPALKPELATDQTRPLIEVERPRSGMSIDAALMKIVAATKVSPLKIMREYTALAFGPGRVSFNEFLRLRLFDDAYYPDKRQVIGWKRNSQINLAVNYRYDWWGMLSDKVASTSYLASFGFPTIPILTVYADRLGPASARFARRQNELGEFLADAANYPLFGKPAEGLQSLGSLALRRFIPDERSVETTDGRIVPLDDVVADIARHYAQGYVFQKLMTPHPAVRALCGDRLATVRIVTIALEGEPTIFRACWKIPAGANNADNYWRPGNLLAQLDVQRGCIVRAMSGSGVDLVLHERHPDTGAALLGAQVPHWPEMVSLVLEAARLMQHVAMIGWDMATLASGPVIVEMNETPDFFLNQLADGRGVLDEQFTTFLAAQRRKRKQRIKMLRDEQRNL